MEEVGGPLPQAVVEGMINHAATLMTVSAPVSVADGNSEFVFVVVCLLYIFVRDFVSSE